MPSRMTPPRMDNNVSMEPFFRSLIMGWWNVLFNLFFLVIFGVVIPSHGYNEEISQFCCTERICKLIAVMKGMELYFTIFYLRGIYSGTRAYVITWIVGIAMSAVAGLIIFPAIMIFTPYYVVPMLFISISASEVFHVSNAILFEYYKDVIYTCEP